ncbi:hypothetical protein ROHU_001990 [Labeo rohita]|uniref:Uncharacterized protein n=1 Tax=Labeo rohita TaxID=84645 RepID=A0A498M2S0_LABRO|nr:hypothetical protein ROHU_009448 [Labeo rohita]RXN37511.1 hypothetical protein ROHU_001990 [Labeo rohita]
MEDGALKEVGIVEAGGGEQEAEGGNTGKAPVGADTSAAVWKYREGSCGSEHYLGSVEIQRKLVLEWTLLRQWGNGDKGSCGSGHYCGSEEIQGNSCWSGHYCGSVEIQGR